jgi:hypothetical protein
MVRARGQLEYQPHTTGPAAAATSGHGYREWNVTSHVQAMYSGSNHGFLIRDAVEGHDAEQQFHCREKGENPPQLVLRFGPDSKLTIRGDRPASR